MKHRRASPPRTPPTIAPVLLVFVPVVAASEVVADIVAELLADPAGIDVVDGTVGLVFFASEGFEVVIVEESIVVLELVPLFADVDVVMTAWLVELELELNENVCAFRPGEEENVMPKGVSTPDPPGVGISSP